MHKNRLNMDPEIRLKVNQVTAHNRLVLMIHRPMDSLTLTVMKTMVMDTMHPRRRNNRVTTQLLRFQDQLHQL